MIFYGDGVVWDASLQKELCKFEARRDENGKRLPGIFETNDIRVITKLRAAGYEGEGEEPQPDPEEIKVDIPDVGKKVEEPKVEIKKEEPKKVEFPGERKQSQKPFGSK